MRIFLMLYVTALACHSRMDVALDLVCDLLVTGGADLIVRRGCRERRLRSSAAAVLRGGSGGQE